MEDSRRLEMIEKSVSKCAESINECSKNVALMQNDIQHQNETAEIRMRLFEKALGDQRIILNGNPHQDTKDRGLIGDVDQLKTSEARKKKYYWAIVTALIMVLIPSVLNLFSGKVDHGRSTETKANKTGPSSGAVLRHNRSRRE